jgi:hypothetical protein
LPNATYVSCRDNGLSELNLPKAKTVVCLDNCLTELNLPNAIEVYCNNKKLTTILNLILDKSINQSKLKITIHIN